MYRVAASARGGRASFLEKTGRLFLIPNLHITLGRFFMPSVNAFREGLRHTREITTAKTFLKNL
ncbi:hypothetical protein M378DRAFT_952384 [Amanita muscaria Koide BX008]|uniref:Uncharacterized protein n=1 Tax=Amanita muscaria (strain Koide BX008) TaxID=946122 RepID=A0A0C2SBC4_AMAMK|nr:hypothetical protein M378DRAFT_952384 [Amanita muscaria Koide BX008]